MRKPYHERADIENIQSQWRKLSGLHIREEWSAAVIRAATAAEIAANFAVRREFAAKSHLEPIFVDTLLQWANGLAGKLDRLLIPITKNEPEKNKVLRELRAAASQINSRRNAVVHQGEFCNTEEAKER